MKPRGLMDRLGKVRNKAQGDLSEACQRYKMARLIRWRHFVAVYEFSRVTVILALVS